MIVGIGTDIVLIRRVEALVSRSGESFAKRILAQAEWDDYHQARDKPRFLAKRFAVKEAGAKSLGTGIREGVSFKDFVTKKNVLGKPILHLQGVAAEKAAQLGITTLHISYSDEQDSVVAFAIAESV